MLLLSLLDLSDFIQLCDAAAILTLYQTGIYVQTAAKLRTRHVDIDAKCLRIGGDIVKNYDSLIHHLTIDWHVSSKSLSHRASE